MGAEMGVEKGPDEWMQGYVWCPSEQSPEAPHRIRVVTVGDPSLVSCASSFATLAPAVVATYAISVVLCVDRLGLLGVSCPRWAGARVCKVLDSHDFLVCSALSVVLVWPCRPLRILRTVSVAR